MSLCMLYVHTNTTECLKFYLTPLFFLNSHQKKKYVLNKIIFYNTNWQWPLGVVNPTRKKVVRSSQNQNRPNVTLNISTKPIINCSFNKII